MKGIQAICFLVMICLARGASLGALNFLTTTSNGDPNSCLLNLTYTVFNNRIRFDSSEFIPDPINRSCTFQDVVSAPIFYNVPFTPVPLNFSNTAPAPYNGNWQMADFNAAKGKSCFLVGNHAPGPQQVYGCRFKFSSVYFYMYIRMLNNTAFDPSWTGILYPELSAKTSTKYGKSIWIPNPAFPHIIGRIADGCGLNNWDNVLNSLNTNATVTGTEYLSNTFDLHAYLDNTYLAAAFALKNGAAANTYRRFQVTNDTYTNQPFEANSPQQCTNLKIKYNTFIPNLNYCDNGCAVSYIIGKQIQAFILMTNGIHTPLRNLRQ